MIRNYWFLFLLCGFTNGIILSQGEYCARLVDNDDYYNSTEDAINCYMDVGNYQMALTMISLLTSYVDDIAIKPKRFSTIDERDRWVQKINLLAQLNRQKAFCLDKIGEPEQGLEVLNDAIQSLQNVEYPYTNLEKLHRQLELLNMVTEGFEDWSFDWSDSDSLRRSTFHLLQSILGYEESFELFQLEYPPIWFYDPGYFGMRYAIDANIADCAIQKTRAIFSRCSGTDCLEALSALEDAKFRFMIEENNCFRADLLYWIGLTHLLSNNDGLGCQSIEAACNHEDADLIDWGFTSSLTHKCNCDLD